MPQYIDKLLCKVKPEGVRGSHTPAIYIPPNYANPGAQKATVDESPLASEEQKTSAKCGWNLALLLSSSGPFNMHCRP